MSNHAVTQSKPNINIGLIGHLDHGGPKLMHALTKVLWKHNPESNRFFSIEDYWAHLRATGPMERHMPLTWLGPQYDTARLHYTVVDIWGFSQRADLCKNKLTGGRSMDAAILVVSATDGPARQTRDHIALARELGVPFTVVALNNVDMVDDPRLLDLVESEVRELLSSYQFPGDRLPVVRLSARGALNGEAKWKATLDELMANMDESVPIPERPVDRPFLMPIEDIFSIQGRGTVVTGRIERGICQVGEEVEIVGFTETRNTVITAIELLKGLVDQGRARTTVGLLLRGFEKKDLQRGQVVAKPCSIKAHKRFKAEVYLLSKQEGGRHRPIFTGYTPEFYFRTVGVTGVAKLPDRLEMALPGDFVVLDVELTSPIAMDEGSRFAIRDDRRNVGFGLVSAPAKP